MDNQLVPASLQAKLPAYRVDPADAQALLVEYGAPFTEAGEILTTFETIQVKDEDDKATMKLARAHRLKLRQVRIGVENKRKELKADIVKRGNAIDGVARFVKEVITPAEEYLQAQEDFAKIKEAEHKVARLAHRIEALSPLTNNTSVYDLDAMSDDDFESLITRLKQERDDSLAAEEKAKAEAAARAEAERLERERIRAENEALRKQAEVERLERAELERQSRERINAERAKREELERAERERREAEEAERRAEWERQRRERLAPDRDKLLSFSRALEVIRTEKLPEVASEEARGVIDKIDRDLVAMQNMITERASKL
ncbi:hypothetical protein BJF87_21260 [Gordonia sp. CNJ-863]|uniref:hypothetical protein n=1 Tax=Gordonia sp. CNJ-863 TaxID=1904963 RepID=UPI000967E02E|nr:hypothetical protein [Gordonia sp. CNJ-863]OLT47746.1 hypothetical protein BJF87_21260 [Gordonia sp. CNJ-863]